LSPLGLSGLVHQPHRPHRPSGSMSRHEQEPHSAPRHSRHSARFGKAVQVTEDRRAGSPEHLSDRRPVAWTVMAPGSARRRPMTREANQLSVLAQ
jgi:hypothetical protein